jgi:hypothetical protein
MRIASRAAACRAMGMSGAARTRARTRFTPQERFTAVGRAPASSDAASSTSWRKASRVAARLRLAARATPIPPATPRAGAPRTSSRRMARTRRSTESQVTTSYRAGRRVWSMNRMVPVASSQEMVGSTPSFKPLHSRRVSVKARIAAASPMATESGMSRGAVAVPAR